jgi:hypothetical protein
VELTHLRFHLILVIEAIEEKVTTNSEGLSFRFNSAIPKDILNQVKLPRQDLDEI